MRKLTIAILFALGLHNGAMAGFTEGANAYNARNYALALKEITPLARAGNADAQHLLGLMYYMGRGVTRDYKQAFSWHYKAAVQGKADAQYVIGAMYYTGNSVPQDHKLAVQWFRRAAEQGHPDAQHALGLMYRYHVAGMPGHGARLHAVEPRRRQRQPQRDRAARRHHAPDDPGADRGGPGAVAQLEAGHPAADPVADRRRQFLSYLAAPPARLISARQAFNFAANLAF